MKTIEEQIKVMQHFANGGEVEIYVGPDGWEDAYKPGWDWIGSNYRIKEGKKTATMEKWLCKYRENDHFYVVEVSNIDEGGWKDDKFKLLATYEVEL
jgi:hypothetical protein